jgi:hypothetical protein
MCFMSRIELFQAVLIVATCAGPLSDAWATLDATTTVRLDGFDMLPVLRGEQKSPRAEMDAAETRGPFRDY